MARIPWTTPELKKHQKRKYNDDERGVIGLLAAEGSLACQNYCKMGLNRVIIKTVLRRLQHDRRQQVALAGMLCATRYKYFNEKGQLLPTQCPNGCGSPDSLEHMLLCYGLAAVLPEQDLETKVKRMWQIAKAISKNTPAVPVPVQMGIWGQGPEEGEISLNEMEGEDAPSPVSFSSSLGVSLVPQLELEFDES